MWPLRLYTVLLRLYPAAFRHEYEREMQAALRHRWRQEARVSGRALLCVSVLPIRWRRRQPNMLT